MLPNNKSHKGGKVEPCNNTKVAVLPMSVRQMINRVISRAARLVTYTAQGRLAEVVLKAVCASNRKRQKRTFSLSDLKIRELIIGRLRLLRYHDSINQKP